MAASTTPRYIAIRESLRQKIFSGVFPPGARLPTEGALAEEYGVSVLTMRRAQAMLVEEGLIEKKQGSGTYVTPEARARRVVLLVCGLATDPALDASAYHAHCLRALTHHCMESGFGVEHLWFANFGDGRNAGERVSELLGQYAGYLFVGCGDGHPVLAAVRDAGFNHVVVGRTTAAPRTVWFDLAAGMDLARKELLERKTAPVRRVLAVTTPGTDELTEVRFAAGDPRVTTRTTGELPGSLRYEIASYHITDEALAGEDPPDAFFFTDDVLARGGTRALLEHADREDAPPVCVLTGRQEMFPWGIPVVHFVHDTEAEARAAVELLEKQVEGAPGMDADRRSPFLRGDDVVAEQPARPVAGRT